MFIRCKSCHGTVWLEISKPGTGASKATCKHCGQHYEVEGGTGSGRNGERLSESARRLACDEDVDLPGAYSVLLGIMRLEELREVSRPAQVAASAEQPRSTGVDARPARFDPAFKEAIDAGHLTARQAMERGGRDSYAGLMAKRHDLPMEVAYAVADNKVSLVEAMRGRGAVQESPVQVQLRANPLRWLKWAAAVLLPVAIFAAFKQGTEPGRAPGEPTSHRIGDAEIRMDSSGRVVQVLGADPRSVLNAYCVSGEDPLHALGTVPSTLHGSRVRLGVFSDPADPATLLAITIREDEGSDRWVAGDGRAPLVADRAPPSAVQSFSESRPRRGGNARKPGPEAANPKEP